MFDPVLYVLRWYPTLSETFVYREIEALQRLGQPVIIAAMGRRADGALNEHLPDAEVWRARPRRLARWARRAGVRRVHAHFEGEASALAMELADRIGVPFSVTVHAAGLFRPRAGITRRLRAAAPVVAVCAHHAAWIARYHGVQAVVVHCGVVLPVDLADPGVQPPTVVCVARDVPKKDLGRLRRAHPAAQILCSSTRAEVQDALRKAQLFALPCRVGPLGSRDGVPVALMEAMAMGLPVVTRPVAGIGALVDETVGWIDSNFEAALAAALDDANARRSRGGCARDRIHRAWSIEGSAAALIAAWDTLRT